MWPHTHTKIALKGAYMQHRRCRPTPKIFFKNQHRNIHPHKISDRYDTPNPFKQCCDRVVSWQRAVSDQNYNLDFFLFFFMERIEVKKLHKQFNLKQKLTVSMCRAVSFLDISFQQDIKQMYYKMCCAFIIAFNLLQVMIEQKN